jgi:hypothetical protein
LVQTNQKAPDFRLFPVTYAVYKAAGGIPVRARVLFIFLLVGFSAASAATATVPKVQYSTYLSGSQFSIITASTADANGFQYVAGVTLAADFPTTPGAYR